MIFSIISQQYIIRKTFYADLDFIQNRNNKFLSSIMLLLLSYCSVFKVQNCYAILPTKLRFVCANSAAHKNFRPFIAYAKFYFIKFCKHGHLLLLVGLRGLEPPTSRLSGVRSNHLSYKPMLVFGDGRRFFVFRRPVVEMRRIELLTPCLQGRCSPS